MLDSIVTILTYPFEIFQRILVATDMVGLFIGSVAVFLVYRFLLKPLFGGETNRSRESKSSNKKGSSTDE